MVDTIAVLMRPSSTPVQQGGVSIINIHAILADAEMSASGHVSRKGMATSFASIIFGVLDPKTTLLRPRVSIFFGVILNH
jgi:hypothetical protein